MHFRRHRRFYLALAAGLAAFALGRFEPPALRGLLAGNVFFAVYLALTAGFVARGTATHLRDDAAAQDEGLPVILLLTATGTALSLGAILILIGQAGEADSPRGLLAVAGVPLGWLTLHTVAAFHYAHLYYARGPDGGDAGGLAFPGTAEPGPWDFLYLAFAIGMCAQVSDVVVRTTRLRRTVLAHGIASFFYNTVILALVVNAVLAFAG
jgi:uncharacterized membrane protein